ncbi:hypothetical protein [uncultured Microbacterium sp.]|uniref:hypothetical protein n=1 Tax=uncultured Microbacterium sp. TaxID=191216 RepID=UPI0035CC86C8
MNPCDLAVTGAYFPVLAVCLVALVLLGLGAVLLVGRGHRAKAGRTLILVILFAAVVAGTGGTVAAQAASGSAVEAAQACPPDQQGGGGDADGGLTIIQTSVNTGIKPGAAPTMLAGEITNHGTTSTFVAEVTVSIDSVTKAPDAVEGQCDAADYVLTYASMPVARTLDPEGSVQFSGAQLSLSDTAANQDACKYATVHLRYVSS